MRSLDNSHCDIDHMLTTCFFISFTVYQFISFNRIFYFKYERSLGGNFNLNTHIFLKILLAIKSFKINFLNFNFKSKTTRKKNYHNLSIHFWKNRKKIGFFFNEFFLSLLHKILLFLFCYSSS